MSSQAEVIVFYGICYKAESEDAAKFQSDDDGETEGVDSPAWMAANLYREAREGVEVIHFGHHDLPGFGLAVGRTARYGESWAPLRISEECFGDPDDSALRAFCEKHGLTWSDPKWWAVPYYG